MQTKKDEVLKSITKAAKEEFMSKTYGGASLNVIAKKAGVSRGAIYTYFKSKADLYEYLCQDAINVVKKNFDFDYAKYRVSHRSFEQELLAKSFFKFAETIQNNRNSFILLFFKSAGSIYENYREDIIHNYSEAFPNWAYAINSDKEAVEGVAGEMLVHTIAGMYITYVEEILLHKPSDAELKRYSDNLSALLFSGMQALDIFKE